MIIRYKDGRLRISGGNYINVEGAINLFLNTDKIKVTDYVTNEDVTYKVLAQYINMNAGEELEEDLKEIIKKNFINGKDKPEEKTLKKMNLINKINKLEDDNTLDNFNKIFNSQVEGNKDELVFIHEIVGPFSRRRVQVGMRYFDIDLDF